MVPFLGIPEFGPNERSSKQRYFEKQISLCGQVAVALLAVVVVQVVEQWHFVWAGWVLIPGQTWLFWFRIAVYLFSLGVRLSLRMRNRTVHPPSSSLF